MCMLTWRHKPASHPPCTDPIGQDQPMEFCCLWGPVGGIQALAILLRRESLPIYILPLLSLSWPKSCIRATTLSKAGCLVFCTLPFFFFFRWRRGKENEITVWWCSWVQVKPGAFDGAASRDSQSLIDCVWKTIVLPRCQALCRRLRALTLAGGERIYSNN